MGTYYKLKIGSFGDVDLYSYIPKDKAKPKAIAPNIKGATIQRVIYSDPATIIIWSDGSKTVAKCSGGDKYDKEKGFYICLLKRLLGKEFIRFYDKESENWK